jgi:hypothetical protein
MAIQIPTIKAVQVLALQYQKNSPKWFANSGPPNVARTAFSSALKNGFGLFCSI